MSITEQVVTDKKGNAIAVQIPVGQYKKILDLLEELDDIKAYKKAKKAKSEWIPFEKAFEGYHALLPKRRLTNLWKYFF